MKKILKKLIAVTAAANIVTQNNGVYKYTPPVLYFKSLKQDIIQNCFCRIAYILIKNPIKIQIVLQQISKIIQEEKYFFMA